MVSWIAALTRTRRNIYEGIGKLFGRSDDLSPESLESLEESLLLADVAAPLAREWVNRLLKGYGGLMVSRPKMLRQFMADCFAGDGSFTWDNPHKLTTILVVGCNGSGKTTTCAKLAYQAKKAGKKVLLAAADTYRAAGSEQLRIWAQRLGIEAVVGATGADAAAVAYDAAEAAVARGMDVLIVDTAGRMHTKQPLMQELTKVKRALAKRIPTAPEEVFIVLDGTIGQNALFQARVFHEATNLTGAVVSKLDGSARAGFIFSVRKELEVPVRFVGLGEGENDLSPFDPNAFVAALLGDGGEKNGKQQQ